MRQFIESGEKERLMELLRERLIECGWKDEMKALCRFSVCSDLCYVQNAVFPVSDVSIFWTRNLGLLPKIT